MSTQQQLDDPMSLLLKRIDALENSTVAMKEPETKVGQDKLLQLMEKIDKLEKKDPTFNESFISMLKPTKSDLPLIIAGVGAAAGGTLVGLVQGLIPQLQGIHPAWVEILIGWLGYKYFSRKNQNLSGFFGGMVIGGVELFVSPFVQQFAGGAVGGSSSSANALGQSGGANLAATVAALPY